jgi:hypothetical protein
MPSQRHDTAIDVSIIYMKQDKTYFYPEIPLPGSDSREASMDIGDNTDNYLLPVSSLLVNCFQAHSHTTAFNHSIERGSVYRLIMVSIVKHSRVIGSMEVDNGLGDV